MSVDRQKADSVDAPTHVAASVARFLDRRLAISLVGLPFRQPDHRQLAVGLGLVFGEAL